MGEYTNRSKFIYRDFDEIQDGINRGEINTYDIIFTKDTHENVIIGPDYSIISVKSKIYRFPDTVIAETELNKASDTYPGQIVSIVYQGKYVAYIVNQRNGKFYVSPLNGFDGEVDYDSLQHRPIHNLEGEIGSPVLVEDLADGVYKINGQYKLSDDIDTVFSSVNSNLFLVQHDNDTTHIKIISTSDITDYTISPTGIVTSVVPTTEWLKEQGYVTEGYVDQKLAALDFINKQELEEYVSDVVLKNINSLVNEQIDKAFDEKFQVATEREALDVFVKIFK